MTVPKVTCLGVTGGTAYVLVDQRLYSLPVPPLPPPAGGTRPVLSPAERAALAATAADIRRRLAPLLAMAELADPAAPLTVPVPPIAASGCALLALMARLAAPPAPGSAPPSPKPEAHP